MTEQKWDFFFQFIEIKFLKCILKSLRSKQFFVAQGSFLSKDESSINLTNHQLISFMILMEQRKRIY